METIASFTPALCDDPLKALAAPPEHTTIVELRADLFGDLDLRQAIAACPLPVLVTLRSRAEGGQGSNDPRARRAILESAYHSGAAMIDLEQDRDLAMLRETGIEPERVVLSWHDPIGTPPDLKQRCAAMTELPARWTKLVPTARSLADLEAVLAVHGRFNRQRRHARRVICFAMGATGIASRYLAPLLGPPLAYVAWAKHAAAAPGQLTIPELESVISHLSGPPQRLYAVVGGDVSESLSPALHSAAYRACAMPYLFVPVSVPDPSELSRLFVPLGHGLFPAVGLDAHGLAVTTPYKERAAEAADLQVPRVRAARAANTLLLRRHQVVAENTDADGVVGAMTTFDIQCSNHTAVVQGTGGAARGAAVGLHLAGATVLLRGRDDSRTRQHADRIGIGWCPADEAPPERSILVNATPLGTRPDDLSPFTDDEVARARVVIDMVYADHQTTLEQSACAQGVPVIDGREVLAHQAYAQFAAFTGKLPPREAMRAALRR